MNEMRDYGPMRGSQTSLFFEETDAVAGLES